MDADKFLKIRGLAKLNYFLTSASSQYSSMILTYLDESIFHTRMVIRISCGKHYIFAEIRSTELQLDYSVFFFFSFC